MTDLEFSPAGLASDASLDASPEPVTTPKKPKKDSSPQHKRKKSRGRSREPQSDKKQPNARPKRADRHKAEAKAATKGGKRACRACGKMKDVGDYAVNQSVCFDCKKALDVIAKKARAAGESEWFAACKADPVKLKRMLTSYCAAVSDAQKVGAKRTSWSVVSYIEEIKATSKVKNIDQGQLMWQDQAEEFWMTAAGGALSKDAARAKWQKAVADMDADGTIWDKEGPEKNPLRLRIKTGDAVNFENSLGRSKCLGVN